MIRQTRRLSACTHGPHGSSQARTDGSGAGHRVVIVGGGFAGLAAARALRRAPVEVTVVDRTNHHLTVAHAGVVLPRLLADRLGLTGDLAEVVARAGFTPMIA